MAIHYQHTQRGTLMLVALIVGALVLAATAYLSPTPSRWLCLALACGLLILAWLFSSLTVIVGDNELRWYFGPGLWQYRMSLAKSGLSAWCAIAGRTASASAWGPASGCITYRGSTPLNSNSTTVKPAASARTTRQSLQF